MTTETNDDNKTDEQKAQEAAAKAANELKLPQTKEELEALINAATGTELKGLKEKLDKAYKARDEALGTVDSFKKKEREAEIKRLEDEGKHREAYDLRVQELERENNELKSNNTALSRDNVLTAALAAMPFRNDRSLEMARREIVAELVQNEQGQWVHKTGVAIKDFVKAFAEIEDNAFLFKAKQSSGSGLGTTNSNSSNTTPKKLSELSQAEVLKLAAEGKLPGRR
jgi:hypothetical protein